MKVLASVFSNLYTDQRVEKVCRTLYENGYAVDLIGNTWGGAPTMERPYPFIRVPLYSQNLKLGYPEFNWKLYFELLKRADKNTILLANDLDVLLPNYLISKKLNIPLVFDSHEIYTEMPSLKGRFTQKIWRTLQKFTVPKIKYMITASESYANWFQKNYGIKKPVVVQNFPQKFNFFHESHTKDLPKIILYQGAINPSRGLDKIIPVIGKLSHSELWIAGSGPKLEDYKSLSKALKLESQIKFLGNLNPEKLREVTRIADVGLSIEENNGLSYFYSLPNKISDYIQARVPVLVSNFPEMKKIVEHFQVGETIENHSEDEILLKISKVLNNGKRHYKNRLDYAAEVLCWEKEEPKILELFEKVKTENFH